MPLRLAECYFIHQTREGLDKHFKKTFKGLISERLSHLEPICQQVAEFLVTDEGWKHEMMLNPIQSLICPHSTPRPRATIRGRSLILSLVAKQLFVQTLHKSSVSVTLLHRSRSIWRLPDFNRKDQTCLTGQTGGASATRCCIVSQYGPSAAPISSSQPGSHPHSYSSLYHHC